MFGKSKHSFGIESISNQIIQAIDNTVEQEDFGSSLVDAPNKSLN